MHSAFHTLGSAQKLRFTSTTPSTPNIIGAFSL